MNPEIEMERETERQRVNADYQRVCSLQQGQQSVAERNLEAALRGETLQAVPLKAAEILVKSAERKIRKSGR